MEQELIIKFNNILTKFSLFKEDLVRFNNEIESIRNEYDFTLEKMTNEFSSSYKVLEIELDKLNAEIDRYGRLLTHYYKEEQLNDELKSRFEKLKTAVKEHVEVGLLNHKNKFDREKNNLLSNFKTKLNNCIKQKDLKQEESEDHLENLIIEYTNFVDFEYNSKKGTCNLETLINFTEPSFDNSTDSLFIGKKTEIIEFGNLKKSIEIPYITNFIDCNNIAIIYDHNCSEKAESISDLLIFRLLFSHLPDKIKIHLFDRNMNQKFKEFLPISNNVISKGYEWDQFKNQLSQTEQLIRSKLSLVWADVEADHNSLYEYNLKMISKDRYDDIIPYYLFVIDDIQDFISHHENLDDIVQRLQNLTNNGCNALFLIKDDGNREKFDRILQSLNKSNFNTVDLRENSSHTIYNNYNIREFEFENLSLESKKLLVSNFNNSLKNIESTRAKLKFKSYALPSVHEWFSKSAASEVTVPIGKSQTSDGLEFISFKTKDMLSNAMLCGGVGSGKTNFLKGVITSLALNYSPEELELWLVDMKNGAGFSIFHNCELPHATKYAFSAESELINDMFFQLKKEMEKRYSDFAAFNIDNLADAYRSESVDKSNLPKRIVLIIDEFATIFSEDAPFLDEISSNLLSLIQKGRAMGINILLAAQNFNNIRNASFNQAVSLIPTRILLKSSPEAAFSVLGHGNHGSVEITRIGEGLINNNYGEINNDGGNFYFKSFLIDNEDLEPIILSIKNEVVSKKLKTQAVKYIDAASPAKFHTNMKLFNQFTSEFHKDFYTKKGINCFIGESYLMDENNHYSFLWKLNARHAGQNILISGNEREQSSNSIFSIISCLTYGVPNGEFSLLILNALDEDFSKEISLNKLETTLENYDITTFGVDDLELLVFNIELQLNLRRSNSERKPLIVLIIGLEKLMQLQKQNYSESDLTQKFKNLMSTASNYGIYFVCEINKPSKLDAISRDLLAFFEHRICFFMNSDESNYIINSKAASQLISNDSPNIRNKAIYFSQSEGHSEKFKSYQNIIKEENMVRILTEKIKDRFSIQKIENQNNTNEEFPSELDNILIDELD
ncbi:MAG: FtsK/SpoIIIE domain-containing protein [Bacteroidota bacterium]